MPTTEPSLKTPWRVVIVEDQRDVRDSWAHLIGSLPEFSCVCACSSGEEAVRVVPPAEPDIILMDIFLPRMSGIECTARLKVALPNSRIVMLTASDDDELVFLALEAGADGYLLKRTQPEQLRAALLDVLAGGAPMTSEVARLVVASFRQKSRLQEETFRLSAREEETLVLLSKGYSNKEIAERLTVGVETVRSHLKHAYEKLHVRSRAEAVGRYMASRMPATDS
jgi:DNA-binding NarL/FixJ family response regulator